MIARHAQTHPARRRRTWCVVLALLLICAPLLSAAQPLLMMVGDGTDTINGAAGHGHAVQHGVAHGADGHAAHAHAHAAAGDCPHCAGDAPPAQCDCFEHAVPAALTHGLSGNDIAHYAGEPPAERYTDPLPRSPRERLYRPPITTS